MGKNKCAICNGKIHDPAVFPKDFPNEWKFCCNCYAIANVLIRHNWIDVILWFEENGSYMESKTAVKRIKKIDELINVNKCVFLP